MKTISDNLERYYKDFIDQTDSWAFFLGLAYYIDFVLGTPAVREIADKLVEQKVAEENKISEMGEKLLEEVKTTKEALFKKIKESGVSYASLTYEMNDYEDFELRGAKSSNTLPATLAESLHDVIWSLSENGHKDLVKDFINERNGIVYIDKHEFSKQFIRYSNERQKYAEREKRELWGFWGYLYFAYVAVLKADEEMARVKKNKANWFIAFNLSGYFGEMKRISEGERTDIIEFKPEKYKSFASIINNHFLKELSNKKDERTEALQALIDMENKSFGIKKKDDLEKKINHKQILDNFQIEINTIEKFKNEIIKQNTEEAIKNRHKIILQQLSPKNLVRVEKVLRIILDELELQGINRLTGENKISVKVLEKEGVFYDEVVAVLNKFDCVIVKNEQMRQELKNRISRPWNTTNNKSVSSAEEELKDYLFVEVKNLNKLKEIKIYADSIISNQIGMKESIKNDILAEIQNKKPKGTANKSDKITLYLSKYGELWREPKNKYCYPIEQNSDRLKIVRYFVEKQLYDYFPTYQIAQDLELETENLSKQIGSIRDITQGKLKIKIKILEAKRDSGYRINPQCKIVAEK